MTHEWEMRNGRWQAKDVTDDLVIDLWRLMRDADPKGWDTQPVGHRLAEWFPWKVVAAKLTAMEKRRAIDRYGFGNLYGYVVYLPEAPHHA